MILVASILSFGNTPGSNGSTLSFGTSRAAGTSQAGKISDPNVAAKRLYNSWRIKNRRAALAVASKDAVEKLFSTRWRPLTAKRCEHTDEGFQCVFHDPKGLFDLSINVDGGASAGYSVTSLSFSSED
jgi:hypothetical protein